MKDKIKVILNNRFVKLAFPLIVFFSFRLGEYILDKTFGNGDGFVANKGFTFFKSSLFVIVAYWMIFNILTILFKIDRKVVIFNLSFTLILLYGIEFYLRHNDVFLKSVFDSNYYYGNIDKYQNFITPPEGYLSKNLTTWGHVTKRNIHDFRDSEIKPKPKGVFRIMVLGDSFTWGAGLGDKEMYANILDSLLKSNLKTDSIEVVNCALSGSPTIFERDVLRMFKDSVKPDLILVGFCVNDPQPKGEDYSIEKENFQKKYNGVLNGFKNAAYKLKLYFFGDLIINFTYKVAKLPSFETALGRVYDKNSVDWKNFTKALTEIKTISDSLNCKQPVMGVFSQVGFTYLKDIKYDEKLLEVTELKRSWLFQVSETAEKIGFSVVNFVPIIDKAASKGIITEKNIIVHPLDGHPSALLNRIYANELYTAVNKSIFQTTYVNRNNVSK